MIERVTLVDPSGHVSDPGRRLAPRLATLQGARVGLVGVTRETIVRVGDLLVERHGAADWLFRQKPNISEPLAGELFDELTSLVDCLVVGVGV
jgi:hypothetical protein